MPIRFAKLLMLWSPMVTVAALSGQALGADVTSVSTLATAEKPVINDAYKPFGTKGQLALDDVVGLHTSAPVIATTFGGVGAMGIGSYSSFIGYSSATFETANPGGPTTAVSAVAWLAPSMDYFIANRVSVGGLVHADYRHQRSEIPGAPNALSDARSGYGLGIRPRVGYVLPLGETIALWPRVGVGYDVARETSDDPANGRILGQEWSARAELGILFRLGRYAYVNIGPELGYVATSNVQTNQASTKTSTLYGAARGTLGLVF